MACCFSDDSSFEDSITSEDSTDDDNNSYAEHVDDSAGSTDGHTDVKKRRKGRNMNCVSIIIMETCIGNNK